MEGVASTRTLEIPTRGNELIPFDLDELIELDSINSIVSLIIDEDVSISFWIQIIQEIWRIGKLSDAIDVTRRGLKYFDRGNRLDQIPLFCMLSTYYLALARKAPRTILNSPRRDKLSRSTLPNHPESKLSRSNLPEIKDFYWEKASDSLKEAKRLDSKNKLVLDSLAALAMARGKLDEASKLFELILKEEPTNLYALMGRARISFSKKNYRPALKSYTTVLSFSPNFLPDPRIGMGLCFWMMGDQEKARKAWNRSLTVHPNGSISAIILLGLSHLSTAKDSTLISGPEGRAIAYSRGIEFIQRAWKQDTTSSTTATALAHYFLTIKKFDAVLKLSERAIQFADSKLILIEGHLLLARALEGLGKEFDSVGEYEIVLKLNSQHPAALLAIAQTLTRTNNYPAASNIYEEMLRRDSNSIEALVSLASIHTYLTFDTRSSIDSNLERIKAKELFEQIERIFSLGKDRISSEGEKITGIPMTERISEIYNDSELFIEIGKIYSTEEDLNKTLSCYLKAQEIIKERKEMIPSKLINNISVLQLNLQQIELAQQGFQLAVTQIGSEIEFAGGVLTDELDSLITILTYNLGIVYELLGEIEEAKLNYSQILLQHSEFVDAKARLALISIKYDKNNELAHSLIKESLTCQSKNPEIRSLYTYFLIFTDQIKLAREFTLNTLREYSRHDLYALCAAGLIHYQQARELKEFNKDSIKEKASKFLRSAEFFEKALLLDSNCTFAAQGLGISIAENTLGVGQIESSGQILSENQIKSKNSRDALTIFNKVKDSLRDGSVYINIGHCYFARDEWEKAIQSYETASKRFYQGKNVSALLYLARSWFHKGSKDRNFSNIQSSLIAARAALTLQPNDLSIIFNVALIGHKGLEIVTELSVERRTLIELQQGISDAEESQKYFDQLILNSSSNTPYPKGIPFQRQRYGISALNRANAAISIQIQFESEEKTKLLASQAIRETERLKLVEIELGKLLELQLKSERLAEQRKALKEAAKEWNLKDDDDNLQNDNNEEEKKKRGASKKKRGKGKKEDGDSEEDEIIKPKKKKVKSKNDNESDSAQETDEEELVGNKYKSKAIIEDSDEG